MATHLLLVDDDKELCDILSEYLNDRGFAVATCSTGDAAEPEILSGKHEIVILDLMLPGKYGLDILRDVRTKSAVPIIILTARGEDTDRIVGLELGADDYLAKPFNPRELVARIRSVLRRGPDQIQAGGAIALGDIVLDPTRRTAVVKGELLTLTATEYDVLLLLVEQRGEILSRESILQHVRGHDLAAGERSIDVHISRLRRKLGNNRIKTIYGKGYILAVGS